MSQITLGGTIDTGASAPAIGVSVGYFQTVAQLRTYASLFTTAVSVLVAGNQASNDDLGGVYTFDPASTAADDGYVTINQTINTGAGRWVLNNTLPIVQTVASLRALPSALISAGSIYVAGNATPGDGLGGVYTYNPASTAADDGYATIQQTVVIGSGRWILGSGSLLTTVNDLEADINAVIAAGDLTPDLGTPGQMLQSMRRIFGGNYEKLTASAALTADNTGLVVVDCTAGNVILALPACAVIAAPLEYIIVRLDATSNTLTINPAGADVFQPGGVSTLVIGSSGLAWINGNGGSVWNIILSSTSYNSLFAAINGNATETFNVGPATTLTEAPEYGQIFGGPSANGVPATINNVTTSRAFNSTYTNSKGKPIFVTVNYSASNPNLGSVEVLVNSIVLGGTAINPAYSGEVYGALVSFLVPPGATYEVQETSCTLDNWSEYF